MNSLNKIEFIDFVIANQERRGAVFKAGCRDRLLAGLKAVEKDRDTLGYQDQLRRLFDDEIDRSTKLELHRRWFDRYRAPMAIPRQAFRIDLTPWAAFV